jgi:tellurite resistance protein
MGFDARAALEGFDQLRLQAVVETMFLAADADGELSPEERSELERSIGAVAAGTPHELALSGEPLGALLAQAQTDLARDGRAGRLAAVKDRLGDPGACRGALGLAVRVTAADGFMRTSEREFIFELAMALGIDQDDTADLVRELTRGS